jgi:PleD family two-component response regulator
MMGKGRILVVEDDYDISNMLRIFFGGQSYEVEVAARGQVALESVRKQLPDLIMLDINLPDMSGYDLCKALRTTSRTSNIPIIFLTQKDERSDKIIGLELGADDYITKPFDIEEVRLRVVNAIAASHRQSQVDAISGLPTGALIEEHLRGLLRGDSDAWTYIDARIVHFDTFSEIYGWSAADEVIRYMALLASEVIAKSGTYEDFIGHPGRDRFVIVTRANDAAPLMESLQKRFQQEVRQHYTFIDRERGYLLADDGAGERRVPLMTLALGSVSPRTDRFSDIREITELAAEVRRRNLAGTQSDRDSDASILTAW